MPAPPPLSINANVFKCMASEGLPFTFFLMAILLDSGADLDSMAVDAILSFLALVDVIEILNMAASGLTTPALLETALSRYMDLFVACYGEAQTLPKHHFARHLPETWSRMVFCTHISSMSADTAS